MFIDVIKNILAVSIVFVGTSAVSATPENTVDVKDWRIRTLQNVTGGSAYHANESDTVFIGVDCRASSRNILFTNPDFFKYEDNSRMLVKVKKAAETPTLVFNDDYDNPYKLNLAQIDNKFYGFFLGATVIQPNKKVLKNLNALKKIKSLLTSSRSVWVGYKNPETGEVMGKKYSLAGSTKAINSVYKTGNCEH